MQIGETISIVHDRDGCEVHYTNHTSGRTWSYSRCPAETRKYTGLARTGINQGLLWTCLIGIIAGLAQGRSMGLNVAVMIAFGIFIWSAVWTLTTRSRSAKRHYQRICAMADEEAVTHVEFIQNQLKIRAKRLKDAVAFEDEHEATIKKA